METPQLVATEPFDQSAGQAFTVLLRLGVVDVAHTSEGCGKQWAKRC
jgi:hypothetical protein